MQKNMTDRTPGSYDDFVAYLGTVRTEEELFAIARRYHVSPGQMLAAKDLPDGTARLDEARRLLVPGG